MLTCVSIGENEELPAVLDLGPELPQHLVLPGPVHPFGTSGRVQDGDLPQGVGSLNVGVQGHGQQRSTRLRQSSSAVRGDLKYFINFDYLLNASVTSFCLAALQTVKSAEDKPSISVTLLASKAILCSEKFYGRYLVLKPRMLAALVALSRFE